MARSQHLRLGDVRRLFYLIGECCELGADPLAWRQHLAQQLPVLFRGQLGLHSEWVVAAQPFREHFWLRPLALSHFGWPTPSDFVPFQEHLQTGRPESAPHVTPDLLKRRLKVYHWSGEVGRHAWQRSEFFNQWVKRCHLDDGIFAHHRTETGSLRWLFVNRALGEQPFGARERRLMALLNIEEARLLGTRLARAGGQTMTDLPRRLRQVLVCLMQGDSEKQVAKRLEISPHTVHDYIKQLHKRFSVATRGELLCRCRVFWPALAALETQNPP